MSSRKENEGHLIQRVNRYVSVLGKCPVVNTHNTPSGHERSRRQSHGWPPPQNRDFASRSYEKVLRPSGAGTPSQSGVPWPSDHCRQDTCGDHPVGCVVRNTPARPCLHSARSPRCVGRERPFACVCSHSSTDEWYPT